MTRPDLKTFEGKRILVTGGAGMIGSTLVRRAALLGAHVTVLDALLPLYGGNLFNIEDVREKITFVEGDIRDADVVAECVRDADYIFNFAAQVSYVLSNVDPFLDLDFNCRGHLTLLDSCRKTGATQRIIFSSSRFVYGAPEYSPVDENHPLNCQSIYGIHKIAAEKYHQFFHRSYNQPTLSLRFTNPYGPRQQMKHNQYGIVNWFIRQALDGEALTIYGDGAQQRDYIFVEDIVEACLLIALAGKFEGEVYNVGSGHGVGFREMTECIVAAVPETRILSVDWPPNRTLVETGDFIADCKKLRTLTGWSPHVSLEEGIRATVDYYRKNRSRYW